ncbi:MAG: SCP2 sterol-binding domain-containing protein [Candidatus Competibacteraceae bacterium]|nr:SCP2 sterol-binding domain-containing protein [Candidatus Competibacteraceae bacterium]
MTPDLIAAGLETAFNAMLRLDPETQSRLAALEGCVIAIEPEGLGLTFYLLPGVSSIRVMDHYEGEPTVSIRGTPLALARQWRGQRSTNSGITVEGDTAVGSEFQVALAQLDIDWEELLSRVVGDAAAHQIGQFWRGFRDWSRCTGDLLLRDGTEYLQQERQVLPPRHAIERFLSAVDILREDADRLAVRIERLRRQLSSADPV